MENEVDQNMENAAPADGCYGGFESDIQLYPSGDRKSGVDNGNYRPPQREP